MISRKMSDLSYVKTEEEYNRKEDGFFLKLRIIIDFLKNCLLGAKSRILIPE